MRKVLITIAVLFVVAVALGATWIFAGPKISMFLDRYVTSEIKSEQIHSIRYEGNGTGGFLHANDVTLTLNSAVAPLRPPSVGSTKDGKLALAAGGKVFAFGPIPKTTDENTEVMMATPENGDDASVSLRHSALSWPTPLDFNFMTGNSPTWKRHCYTRLTWQKSNGARLEMVWRYEQYFYSGNGWTDGDMTREGSTGLIEIKIMP
jgi:hypothetical protein